MWRAVLLLCCLLPPTLESGQAANGVVIPSIPLLINSTIDSQRDPGPQLPCGKDPIPQYPRLGEPAIVKAWSKSDLGAEWEPPACTGWREAGFSTLVTISARFSNPGGSEVLLRHIGAVSQLAGLPYWSTTHRQWRTLIKTAYALTAGDADKRRGDFTPSEMSEGKILYFEQIDNLAGRVKYQMKIIAASQSRLVFGVENVSTVKYSLLSMLDPGELQSMYFFEQEKGDVWRYYSILRTGKKASRLIAGNKSSTVNRAAAFYRHFVGIPVTQEPPAARE